MSCYHPLIGIRTGEKTASGKDKIWIRRREDSADFQREIDNNDCVLLPCGHCIGCRLDYSRSWADRMMLELETAGKGIFLTLTYDNDHVPVSSYDAFGFPEYFTLDKRDCQLFMKRLRKEFADFRIRFYLAGEYGETTARPHYHAILFGLGLSDLPGLQPHGRNELGQQYYICPLLSQTWSRGFVLVSDVSWKTCAYVARYVTKKLSGPLSLDYAVRNCIPEFSLMSRKPGIGAQYLLDNPDCLDMANINLATPEGALKIRIPKYYYRQLSRVPVHKVGVDSDGFPIYEEFPEENPLYDPERYDKIMEDRKRFAEDSMMLELSKTHLSLLDYLELKEQKKLESAKLLKRSDVQ